MLLNYLKIALRNLRREKLYSLLNILGLSLGLAVTLGILLYIQDELNVNQFHSKKDRIHRVVTTATNGHIWSVPPYPAAPVLKTDIPDILQSTRLFVFDDILVKYGEKVRREVNFGFADNDLFGIFDFPLIAGDSLTVLNNPQHIVISQEIAADYFGEEDPMGKALTVMVNGTEVLFTIGGVLGEIPSNSMYRFNFIVPFESADKMGYNFDGWASYGAPTFVLLQEETSPKVVNEKIEHFITQYSPRDSATLHLEPFANMHLYTLDGSTGPILYIYMFGAIGLLVLLLACINFMNLSTARAMNRAKEIGIRKVVGAQRRQLIFQFFGESLLMTVLATFLALCWIQLILPGFNELTGKQMSWQVLIGSYGGYLLAVVAVTAILAGSYPAMMLSGMRPIGVLKGPFKSSKGSRNLRQLLVITQFALSVTLIICTLIIQDQFHFIQHKNLGFDREHVVYMDIVGDSKKHYQTIKERLSSIPQIQYISSTSTLPTRIYSYGGVPRYQGDDPEFNVNFLFSMVDYDYLKTFGMEVAAGRDFSKEFSTDSSLNLMLNETAVKLLKLENPVGRTINWWGNDWQVIGVVKDFHNANMEEEIKPLVLVVSQEWVSQICIRLAPGDPASALAAIQETWEETMGNIPFDYHFLDDTYDEMYIREKRVAAIFSYFAYLAIFVSCLGLFGLATFGVFQRGKEIGVRKVLGANASDIVKLLAKDFTRPVVIGVVLAIPIAYLLAKEWLATYAYQVEISPWRFILAVALTIGFAMLTISFQSTRAALTNPAEVLKDE